MTKYVSNYRTETKANIHDHNVSPTHSVVVYFPALDDHGGTQDVIKNHYTATSILTKAKQKTQALMTHN